MLNYPLIALRGRERELAALGDLLLQPDVRLLTITGPGGVGKTSLALEAVRNLEDAFCDGVFFVSLAAIHDLTLIIPTIAQALEVVESPDRLLLESLEDFLRARQILLLLDNFEHLIRAAPLLTELVMAADKAKLLITSREALNVRGEQEFPLAPLEFCERGRILDQPSLEILSQYASISLFVERARSSQPDFGLTQENAAAVAEICARLDGLPLAVELAAARIRLLPPQAILDRLQKSPLQLLTGGARDAPTRQKTLRDTIQWSYDLLGADEQRVFHALSVFTGGCNIEAIEALLNDWGPGINHLDLLTSLLNKNLLRRAGTDSEPRIEMLETIREFGLHQSERMKQLETLQRLHANYYLSLAEATAPLLMGRDQKTWLGRLEREQNNFRAALLWGFTQPEDAFRAEYVLRLTGALTQFWFLRGQWSEGRRWLEEAISASERAPASKALRAKVLYLVVPMIVYQGDLVRARVLCEQSVGIYRELDDQTGLLAALLHLCRTLDYQNIEGPLRERAQEALELAKALPDSLVKAQAYQDLSMLSAGSAVIGLEAAIHLLEESEQICRNLESPVGLAYNLFLHAGLLDRQGDEERAQQLFAKAEQLAVEVEDHRMKMVLLSHRMISSWHRGDYTAVRREFEQLMNHQANAALSKVHLDVLAASLHRQRLSIWAARVFGMAEKAFRAGPRKRLVEPIRESLEAVKLEVRVKLGEQTFDSAFSEGFSMTRHDLLVIPNSSPNDPVSGSPSTTLIEPLTNRELDVLRELAQDLNNPQIAERLVISRRTVDAHLRAIYAKLGVRSRDAAVRVAREQGLFKP